MSCNKEKNLKMKIIAYILTLNLLVANFFPSQNLGELAKVFSLIDHWHHHETESNIDFWAYLMLHYTDHQHHEQDHKQHEDLPFHSHQQNQNLITYFVGAFFTIQYEQKAYFSENKTLFSIYKNQFSSLFIADIWQPPKF
jgi:hypothetical protein